MDCRASKSSRIWASLVAVAASSPNWIQISMFCMAWSPDILFGLSWWRSVFFLGVGQKGASLSLFLGLSVYLDIFFAALCWSSGCCQELTCRLDNLNPYHCWRYQPIPRWFVRVFCHSLISWVTGYDKQNRSVYKGTKLARKMYWLWPKCSPCVGQGTSLFVGVDTVIAIAINIASVSGSESMVMATIRCCGSSSYLPSILQAGIRWNLRVTNTRATVSFIFHPLVGFLQIILPPPGRIFSSNKTDAVLLLILYMRNYLKCWLASNSIFVWFVKDYVWINPLVQSNGLGRSDSER